MFCVRVTRIEGKKQTNEVILETNNKDKADCAFIGTLLGIRYDLKNKQLQEVMTKNKAQLKYDNNMIIVTIKEK